LKSSSSVGEKTMAVGNDWGSNSIGVYPIRENM